MEKRINIAEILKDCPKGMELDCTMYNGVVTLEQVQPLHTYSIKIRVKCGDESFTNVLTEYGQTSPSPCNKCVIFPKGKTTWEGFQRPFKDGDVVINDRGNIFIYKGLLYNDKNRVDFYCGYLTNEHAFVIKDSKDSHFGSIDSLRLATEEEKQKLFDAIEKQKLFYDMEKEKQFYAIKDNGYRWNAETKTLEKLIKPKFKIGDRIRHKLTGNVYEVSSFLSNGYGSGVYEIGIINELIVKIIDIKEQDNYELAPNKFDITTLKPFDKVLVRDEDGQKWMCDIFSYYDDTNPKYPFWGVGRSNSKQCIPYKGNEHLLGTTNDCDEFYKNW